MFWRLMCGWVPGSAGLLCGAPLPPCQAPAPALAPPASLDFAWSWRGFPRKTQGRRGLPWTAALGAMGRGEGERRGLLRPGKSFCHFSGKAAEAAAGQWAAPGAVKRGRVVASGAGGSVGLLSSFQLWHECGTALTMPMAVPPASAVSAASRGPVT